LRIELLFEADPLPGEPGVYGQFETGAAVQNISRTPSQVVKELKERDAHAKQKGREVAKRSGCRPTSWEMHWLQRWSADP
jgi:hypothetical protein